MAFEADHSTPEKLEAFHKIVELLITCNLEMLDYTQKSTVARYLHIVKQDDFLKDFFKRQLKYLGATESNDKTNARVLNLELLQLLNSNDMEQLKDKAKLFVNIEVPDNIWYDANLALN